jgi:hypothetical protein
MLFSLVLNRWEPTAIASACSSNVFGLLTGQRVRVQAAAWKIVKVEILRRSTIGEANLVAAAFWRER